MTSDLDIKFSRTDIISWAVSSEALKEPCYDVIAVFRVVQICEVIAWCLKQLNAPKEL